VTILHGLESARKREMLCAILEAVPVMRNIPICLSRCGLRVWDSPVVAGTFQRPAAAGLLF